MTERGRGRIRRDSHDEKPYCTWRAQKLVTNAPFNGRGEKILDASGPTNVPATDQDESVTNPLFMSPLPRETPAAAAASPCARKNYALTLRQVLPAFVPETSRAFPRVRGDVACITKSKLVRPDYDIVPEGFARVVAFGAPVMRDVRLRPFHNGRLRVHARSQTRSSMRARLAPIIRQSRIECESLERWREATNIIHRCHTCARASAIATRDSTRSTREYACIRRDQRAPFDALHGGNSPCAGCPCPVKASPPTAKIAFLTGVRVVSPYCILRGSLYLPPSTDPFPHE
jgi:hypothetical protein